ncbi:hypothetical protein DI43_19285 [Geobacillus sp. CAMR12739]|nr:hypothetical protein DI43_19285 [Geobacillus sp. CAMR12739]
MLFTLWFIRMTKNMSIFFNEIGKFIIFFISNGILIDKKWRKPNFHFWNTIIPIKCFVRNFIFI